MGRPKTPDAQRRKLRRVGMVDAEWASVQEAAARCGVPASAWAAAVLAEAARLENEAESAGDALRRLLVAPGPDAAWLPALDEEERRRLRAGVEAHADQIAELE